MSKYGAFSGPNTVKYRPEKILYFETFHAVCGSKEKIESPNMHPISWILSKISVENFEMDYRLWWHDFALINCIIVHFEVSIIFYS